MEKFIKGDVVVLPFPFSDLSGSKRRPALILADLKGNDFLLCQITSQPKPNAIYLSTNDFTKGSLLMDSYIRPTKLFTADRAIFNRRAGHIEASVLSLAIDNLIKLLNE